MRRKIIDINYTNNENVEKYLKENLNEYLKLEGKSMIDQKEINYITKNIGGNITDINTIIVDLMRGENIFDSVDRLVMDSVKKVSWVFLIV